MKDIVIIKPKKNSRVFVSTNMEEVSEFTDDKGIKKTEIANWDSERFPKSKPFIRPYYNSENRRWDIGSLDNDTLQKLVKECKFRYESNHPKAGQLIESSDPYDFYDPFFNSPRLKVITEEGVIPLFKKHARDRIIYESLTQNPFFQEGSSDNPIVSARARHIIVNDDLARNQRKSERDKDTKATILLDKMSATKRAKVALILEIIPTLDVDADIVEDGLYEYIDDKTSKSLNDKIKRDEFISVASQSNEEISREVDIALAKSKGLIRPSTQGYNLFGNVIGKTMGEVKDFLQKPENSSVYERMINAMNKE